MAAAEVSPGGPKVSFLTDVEGNWEFLERFVEMSDALDMTAPPDASGAADIALRDGWHLVIGGDLCDKGGLVGGTVRVVRSCVALKKKYPDRVTIVLGNRDINKMRFTSELTPAQLENGRLERVPGPYWVAEPNRITPLMFLRGLSIEKYGSSLTDSMSVAQIGSSFNTIANRLRWILKETMGADGEMERRRGELAFLEGVRHASISIQEASSHGADGGSGEGDSDYGIPTAEVVASFTDCVKEGGFMRELFELGQLATIIGSTLFVHGGVVSIGGVALGSVPGIDRSIYDVHEWVAELNRWYDRQLQDWINRPYWEDDDKTDLFGSRGGHDLMDYVVPSPRPSVVLGKHLTKSGMPQPLDEALTKQLNDAGIFRICVGHTPHGSCPTVIKCPGFMPQPGNTRDADCSTDPDRSHPHPNPPAGSPEPQCASGGLAEEGAVGAAGTPPAPAEGSAAVSVPPPAVSVLPPATAGSGLGVPPAPVASGVGRRPTVLEATPVLEIIMADTSYSDMKADDNRGKSVSEVQLFPDGRARIFGRIADGRTIDYTLGPVRARIRHGEAAPPAPEAEMDLIGLREPMGARRSDGNAEGGVSLSRFVKAWLPESQAYLLCNVDGFKHCLNEMPRDHAHFLFGEGNPRPASPPTLAGQRSSSVVGSETSASRGMEMVSYHSAGDEGCSHLEEGDDSHFTNSLLQLLFSTMDSNNNGVISSTELVLALTSHPEIRKLLAGTGQTPQDTAELMRDIDTGGNGTISHDELRAYLFRIKKFDRKEAFPRRKRESDTPSLAAIGRSITAGARMQRRGMPGMEHSGRGAMGFRSGSVANTTGEGFRPHRHSPPSPAARRGCCDCLVVGLRGASNKHLPSNEIRKSDTDMLRVSAPSIATQMRV